MLAAKADHAMVVDCLLGAVAAGQLDAVIDTRNRKGVNAMGVSLQHSAAHAADALIRNGAAIPASQAATAMKLFGGQVRGFIRNQSLRDVAD